MVFILTSRWLSGFFYHHQNLASAFRLVLLLPTMLDYGRACLLSRTTSGEDHRGRTTSGQVRVSIMNPESMANFVVKLEVEKP